MFLDVTTMFLRAIRTGTIHIRHSATLLAHYGRFGYVYDQCCVYIVNMLRDEGLRDDQGDLLVAVLTQSLREVRFDLYSPSAVPEILLFMQAFTLVIDEALHDETAASQLAKLLASCFTLRGAQLTVIRRLDGQYVVQIHTTLLTWLGKHLANYQSSGNKKSLRLSILFFRVLVPLLTGIPSRDALKMSVTSLRVTYVRFG